MQLFIAPVRKPAHSVFDANSRRFSDVLQGVGRTHDSHLCEHARYGSRAGQVNPNFLNADAFTKLVLQPYRDAQFGPNTGPFLFEFQRHGMPAEEFIGKLDDFFDSVSAEFRYAVEIRNAGLLGPRYHDMLRHTGVAHVYNHWSYMPPAGRTASTHEDHDGPVHRNSALGPIKNDLRGGEETSGTL